MSQGCRRCGLFAVALLAAAPLWAEDETTVLPAQRGDDGVLTHEVRCPYQSGATQIRVLLPQRRRPGERFPVLYVLPVEAGRGSRYGDGLDEVLRLGLHDKRRLICVAPTFSHLPWYADHPDDAGIRQETYLLKVVLPAVERLYPAVAERRGRLLVGFSKSGWGAFSLLLRHPDVFERAAAWDAPLAMAKPNRFGMGPIFGTQENFEGYRITALLERRAEELARQPPRLAHFGYGNFRDQHESVEALLKRLQIPHVYHDGPQRKHNWNSGWLPQAVEFLVRQTGNPEE